MYLLLSMQKIFISTIKIDCRNTQLIMRNIKAPRFWSVTHKNNSVGIQKLIKQNESQKTL